MFFRGRAKYFEAASSHDVKRQASHPCHWFSLALESQFPSLEFSLNGLGGSRDERTSPRHAQLVMSGQDLPSPFFCNLCCIRVPPCHPCPPQRVTGEDIEDLFGVWHRFFTYVAVYLCSVDITSQCPI